MHVLKKKQLANEKNFYEFFLDIKKVFIWKKDEHATMTECWHRSETISHSLSLSHCCAFHILKELSHSTYFLLNGANEHGKILIFCVRVFCLFLPYIVCEFLEWKCRRQIKWERRELGEVLNGIKPIRLVRGVLEGINCWWDNFFV